MEREKARIARFNKNRLLDGDTVGQQVADKMNLSTAMEEEEEGVRSNKKKELREHQKII